MKINLGGHHNLAIMAYNSHDKFLPYFGELFGNTYQFLTMPENGTTFTQRWELDQTHWRAKSQQHAKCADETNESSGGGLDACVNKFIEDKTGCSSVLQTTAKRKQVCNTYNDYVEWARLSQRVSMAISENEVYVSQCLSPCDRFQYKPMPD